MPERMNNRPTVAVVDDDEDVRSSIQALLESVGIQAQLYPSADAYLVDTAATSDLPRCLLLDVRMPGISGMTLLERLTDLGRRPPTIVMTGHGDIPMAVAAMKLGAADFLTKPVNHQLLLDAVQKLLRRQPADAAPQTATPEEAVARWQRLTAREREVFERIAAGDSNKVVAYALDISVRTVETHRARIMEKLDADSLVDLVLLAVQLNKG